MPSDTSLWGGGPRRVSYDAGRFGLPPTGEDGRRSFDRRTILRAGGVAAAGASVAALLPAERADAVSPAATTTLDEAFGGVTVPPRALERWLTSRATVLNVVCVGDSITQGSVGGFDFEHSGAGCWVERLAVAMGRSIGPLAGVGFRGLWLGLDIGTNSVSEWRASGTWTRTTPKQVFDVCPFGDGFYSSGGANAVLTWTKPASEPVIGFELYWFQMQGAGNWQYRVDNGVWTNMGQTLGTADNKLHKFYVSRPVHARVEIRAYDGHAACTAPIGGISVYARDPETTTGVVVHNLGRDEDLLASFVRASSGDPLAWLDSVVSSPPTLAIKPALVVMTFSNDVELTSTTVWRANLLKLIDRVQPYADVLLMSPYEQSGPSTATQTAFRAVTESVAVAQDCALLDLYDAWAGAGATGWAAANAGGLMYDGLHPSALGHQDIAGRVWRLLRTFS